MKLSLRLKQLLGLEKFSKYVEDYFGFSNVRSSIYLSIVVIALEIWMIASAIWNQIFSESKRSAEWFITHVASYVLLLAVGIIMLIYAFYVIRHKTLNKKASVSVYNFFTITAILFGMYISYLDYIKGEQFITLMTMTLFVFCFLVWRPIYTLIVLTSSFLIFRAICNKAVPTSYATNVNLFIVWISILMSAFNAYHQKIKEAKKDEKLEQANNILLKLSISDEITGIANMSYFLSQTLEKIHDRNVDISKMIFLFLDIENFKNYNEKYSFLQGNEFLKTIAEAIEKAFPDSIVAHFSNDNFVIFTKDFEIAERLEKIQEIIIKTDSEIKLTLKTGAYRPVDRDCLPIVACDYARYACYSIKKHFSKSYCEYTSEMDLEFHRKQYIINNIDKAIENEFLKVFYQPVVNSSDGKVVGVEALARWDDPEFGLLMPSLFINTLEEYRQIHKLDMFVLERVCKDIVEHKKNNGVLIPVSLNFSRLDFEAVNLVNEVESCLDKYQIDKSLIHVEITETALTDNDNKLHAAMDVFRKAGHTIWLDDFGSGYSGLNVLKEYQFDVMKIDMKFLHNFSNNPKAHAILKNIVTLAKDIGMNTLTEGVETEEARNFLREIGCEKLQGYLFGKPMAKEEFVQKTKDGLYILDDSVRIKA